MIKKIGSNKYGVVEYAISSVEDIADLPLGVAIGSTAVLINKDGIRTFALGEGEWVEYIDAERYDKNKLAQDLLFCGFGNDGEKHDDLDDRLIVEFDEINERVNVGNYLEYNGCHVKADYSLEGLQRGVMLEGKTLQNLCDNRFSIYGTSGIGGGLAMTFIDGYMEYKTQPSPNTTYITIRPHCQKMMKNNTTYTIIFDIKENTIPNYNGVTVSGVGDCYYTNDLYRLYHNTRFTLDKGIKKIVVTTGNDVNEYTGFGFGFPTIRTDDKESGLKFIIGNTMVLEGDHTNTPLEELPYIEGIESVGESELTDDGYKISGKSIGKNLFKDLDSFVNRFIQAEVGYGILEETGVTIETTIRITMNKVFELKPNTDYVITCKQGYGIAYTLAGEDMRVTSVVTSWSNKCVLNNTNNYYLRLTFKKSDDAIISPNESKDMEIQIEETSVESSYEPYQESTYSYILDEPLRSLPNGVCDTIDFETGVLTRRVGKVVLDGSESWKIYQEKPEENKINTISFICDHKRVDISDLEYHYNICDKFPSLNHYNYDIEGVFVKQINSIRISINRSKLSKETIVGFKEWLQVNPTILYYKLGEPIIHQLDQNRIYNFKDTTHITSDNLIAPRITTNILTNSNALISHLKGENLALTNEVSTLSLRNREMQETNETQDHIIDASLCAVDELYMMYETTQEVEAMSVDEEGSRMVDMYVAMVQRGLKTIDQVPIRYREKVREILAQLED